MTNTHLVALLPNISKSKYVLIVKYRSFFLNTQYATFKIKSKEEKFRQTELVCRANHLKFENRKCQDFFLPQSKNKHAEQRPYLDKDSSVHNGFG